MPSHRRRTAAVLFVLVAALALAGCGDSGNKSTNPPPNGGLELNSGSIGPGGQYDHRFLTAGTFGYHCTIHGSLMPSGAVSVADGFPPGDTAAVVSIVSIAAGYSPANIQLHTGGHVTWVNNDGGMPHTVTSQ
jgi:plastocyanin